ncbi:hypothetical protein BH09MYX1_BH09MYX1_60790 [soil metagenome]
MTVQKISRYSATIVTDTTKPCGWLRDKFDVSWRIVIANSEKNLHRDHEQSDAENDQARHPHVGRSEPRIMTSDANEPRPLRSVAAVLGGFFVTFLLSVVTDGVMRGIGVFPTEPGVAMSNALFALALAYRTLFTAIGGYVAAGIAPRNPMTHAFVLAGLGVFAGLVGLAATWGKGFGPEWYSIALVALSIPSIVLGGKFGAMAHARRSRRGEAPVTTSS